MYIAQLSLFKIAIIPFPNAQQGPTPKGLGVLYRTDAWTDDQSKSKGQTRLLQLTAYLNCVVHDNGRAEPDEGGDNPVGLDAADQGDAALCALLQTVQNIRLPI